MRILIAVLSAGLFMAGAQAQFLPGPRAEDRAVIEACLDAQPVSQWAECRGLVSRPCDADAAQTQIHASLDCVAREAAIWRVLSEEHYETALEEWRSRDAEGMERLQAAQAAFRAYRDAECAFLGARTRYIRTDAMMGLTCSLRKDHERVIELRLAVR